MNAEAEGGNTTTIVIALNGNAKLTYTPSAEGGTWAVDRGWKTSRYESIVDAERDLMEVQETWFIDD